MKPESATQAALRAAATITDQIRQPLPLVGHNLTTTPDRLREGNVLRVAGEWAAFVAYDPDTMTLTLTRADSACEWLYECSVGERFLWDEGAF